MASLLKVVAVALAGVVLGLLVTIAMLNPDARGVKLGPWRGAARGDGTAGIDPYGLASTARSGLLPPGAAEGASFVAAADSGGAALSPDCDYIVAGAMPVARFWSLSILTPEGFPIANPAGRFGFTSAEVLREDNLPAVITVSAHARPGNWLPVGSTGRFVLMLRLYEPASGTAGSALDAASMPSVEKSGCR